MWLLAPPLVPRTGLGKSANQPFLGWSQMASLLLQNVNDYTSSQTSFLWLRCPVVSLSPAPITRGPWSRGQERLHVPCAPDAGTTPLSRDQKMALMSELAEGLEALSGADRTLCIRFSPGSVLPPSLPVETSGAFSVTSSPVP